MRLWTAQLGVRVVHDEVQRGLVRTMVLDCLLVSYGTLPGVSGCGGYTRLRCTSLSVVATPWFVWHLCASIDLSWVDGPGLFEIMP